jgi:hypothetical protein
VASVCVAGLPCTMLFVARVAQGIEHRSPKAGVVSSNLIPGTFFLPSAGPYAYMRSGRVVQGLDLVGGRVVGI